MLRCYTKKKEFFFRRQKWPIEADNEQFNLVGSRILRRDKFIRHKFGATRLLLLFPPFLFSNRRNRDCSTWLYDNIFDIESIRGNRGSILRASFIGKHNRLEIYLFNPHIFRPIWFLFCFFCTHSASHSWKNRKNNKKVKKRWVNIF